MMGDDMNSMKLYPPVWPRRVTGFGLWDSLLLVMLVATLLAVAFITQQAHLQQRIVEQQAATVRWADRRVTGFVMSHLRLPCPDSNDDGYEDCGAGAGWLPLLTLGLKADAAVRGPVRIKYNPFRPAGMDPTQLSSYFEPWNWKHEAYSYGTSNGLDLCAKLVDIVSANAGAVLWSVAIERRDGMPDLVRSHAAADLSRRLGCNTALYSVNGIALAVDVVKEVQAQRQKTHDDSVVTIAMNAVEMALIAVDITMAAIDLASSVAALSIASGLLAGAIASCVVLVGCAFIPVYTAAVVLAGVSIGLFGVAIGLAAAGLATLIVATVQVAKVANMTGGAMDNSVDVDPQVLYDAAVDADNEAADALAERNQAYQDMQNAQSDMQSIKQDVYDLAETLDPDDHYDALVNTAMQKARARVEAHRAEGVAHGAYDEASKKVDKLEDSLAEMQDRCASPPPDTPEDLADFYCDSVPKIQQWLQDGIADRDAKYTAWQDADAQFQAAKSDCSAARLDVYSAFYNDTHYDNSSPITFLQAYALWIRIGSYRVAYRDWQGAADYYHASQVALQKANAAAASAWDAYNNLVNQDKPGGVESGSGIQVWQGAEAILEQADANGALE